MRTPFKEKNRSKFNQQPLKEIRMGILGQWQTFGDIDSYRQRKYLYTMRTYSSDVILYEFPVQDFVLHLKSNERELSFRKWQRIQN